LFIPFALPGPRRGFLALVLDASILFQRTHITHGLLKQAQRIIAVVILVLHGMIVLDRSRIVGVLFHAW
jgi:hypothetical protein